MEFLRKCLSCFKYHNNEIYELKKEVEELKKNNIQSKNPLHSITREAIEIKKLDQKVDEQNIDVLTKIVYLKEEIQRLDSKVKELEVSLNSSDNYCIIENKLGGDTSDDNTSDEDNTNGVAENKENTEKINKNNNREEL